MRHRNTKRLRTSVATGAVVAVVLCSLLFGDLTAPRNALGVSASGKPSTVVTPATAGSAAQYVFARFRTANRENVTGCAITFPAGTNVTGAVAVNPAGTVVVSGQTVTITFTNPVIPERVTFDVTIGGIVNPVAGTYNAGNITLFWVNTQTNATGSTALATANYTITTSYLSMTITTPAVGQTVDFGSIDPGVTTPAQTVTVQVDSSAPYTLSRTPGGDAALLGLNITGPATGLKPQGIGTFSDAYTLTPPWTTDPSVPLTATVLYTAIQ